MIGTMYNDDLAKHCNTVISLAPNHECKLQFSHIRSHQTISHYTTNTLYRSYTAQQFKHDQIV